MDPASELNERHKWSDGCKLLFQDGYLEVLKNLALSGELQKYSIRGVCWKLFLGCLPEDKGQWEEASLKNRQAYEELKKEYLVDPHSASSSLDLALNNPLSQAEESPWNTYFVDGELKQMIGQDIVRTFPDIQFFRQPEIQNTMMDVLFCYAKSHPDMCYRQGMHELLAPIIFVLHSELRDVYQDSSLAPVLKVVMDPDYVDHDAYTLFAELMEGVGPWYMNSSLEMDYVRAQNQTRALSHDPRTRVPFENDCISNSSAIGRKLHIVHDILLKRADEKLYEYLTHLSIPPQTYGIRWLRLLFGREFPLPVVLELWDALFSNGSSLPLVDYMSVAMLIHIRDMLLNQDYATCLKYLMAYPTVYEVNYLIQRALHLRNPAAFPLPTIWAVHPLSQVHSNPLFPHSSQLSPPPPPSRPIPTSAVDHTPSVSRTSKASAKARQVLSRALARPAKQEPSSSHEHSPPPPPAPPPEARRQSHTSSAADVSKEMTKKVSLPLYRPSMDREESLSALREKCVFCGGKMDVLLEALQSQLRGGEQTSLAPATEDTVLLAIAGLKQVKDLLLNKIAYSDDVRQSWVSERSFFEEHSSDSNSLEPVTGIGTMGPAQSPTGGGGGGGGGGGQGSEDGGGSGDGVKGRGGGGLEASVEEVGEDVLQYHPLVSSEDLPPLPTQDSADWVHVGETI